MPPAQAWGPCRFTAPLLAVVYLVARDGVGIPWAGLVFLAGGAAVVAIATTATDDLLRLLPATGSDRTWRRIATGLLVGVPVLYAGVYARSHAVESMPMTLVLVAALAAGVIAVSELVVPRLGLARAMPGIWPATALSATQLGLAFAYLHVSQQTLVVVKSGSEALHQALFLGTWLACLGLAVPWGVRALARTGRRQRGRWPTGCAIVAVAAGIALFEYDQRQLVGLHPELHQWLELVALLSLDAGALVLLACAPTDRASPIARGVEWTAQGALAALAVSFVVITPDSVGAATRARLLNTAMGPALIELRDATSSAPRSAVPIERGHPDLEFARYHDEVEASPRHNVLLLTIDTIRGDVLDGDASTVPTLARLANRCASFTRAYAPGPRTAIGLGGLMYGRYSAHLRWDLWRNHRRRTINPRTATPEALARFGDNYRHRALPRVPADGGLATRMRAAGMHTMAVAFASGNPILNRALPFSAGFDDYEDTRKVVPRVKTPSTKALVELALAQVEARSTADGYWFQWLHLFDPHESGGNRGRYDKLVSHTDRGVEHVLAGLDSLGELDDTVVMIAGDHGEGLGDHRFDTHGTALYDEQVRVPMIVCVPGAAPLRHAEAVSTLDVAATAVALAGGDLTGFDGVNLLPLIRDGRFPANRPVFVELHRFRGHSTKISRDIRGVVRGRWKFVHDRLRGGKELYDLDADPREQTNRLDGHPGVARELEALLGSFLLDAER